MYLVLGGACPLPPAGALGVGGGGWWGITSYEDFLLCIFFFLAVNLGIFAVLSDHILLFNYKLLHICLISESSDCSDSIYVGYMIIYICFFSTL